MDKRIKEIIDHFKFEILPVEGTLFRQTYRSSRLNEEGAPLSTAMIGMYCNSPLSFSSFHKLTQEETWHFYFGDPLFLYLLHENGSVEEIVMGQDFEKGQVIQYTVPAGVWQAGCTIEGGKYSVFGCTLAPGFTSSCFQAATKEELLKNFPQQKDIILKLSITGDNTKMPEGF
jgi:predicted cupin superfamily sugar epimerase